MAIKYKKTALYINISNDRKTYECTNTFYSKALLNIPELGF
jgi:hypothetical protein